MLVHAHRTLVLAAAAKQVTQREMQLRRVGVTLDRFDEGINGLVLLFIQQKIQAFEVGLGCLVVFDPQLAHIESRSQPAQYKDHWQGEQDQANVKFHKVAVLGAKGFFRRWLRAPLRGARGLHHAGVATNAEPSPKRPAAGHRQTH